MTRKPTRAKQLGVTDDEYARLLEAQGGGCAICGATPKTRRLHVDHDHATGKVRGLLCHRCNRALPAWVSSEWLRCAAGYLGTTLVRVCPLCERPMAFDAHLADDVGTWNPIRSPECWQRTPGVLL